MQPIWWVLGEGKHSAAVGISEGKYGSLGGARKVDH